VAVVEAIGTGCASTAAILCTYQLGAFPILLAGRDDQKQHYLGEMVKGVATSFALSERNAGSDAAAIEATATREGQGQAWRLRGEKYWIGNGGASRYYVVFAKTEPSAGGRGISAFMLDGQPGAVIDKPPTNGHPRHADVDLSRYRGAGQRAGRSYMRCPGVPDPQCRARVGSVPNRWDLHSPPIARRRGARSNGTRSANPSSRTRVSASSADMAVEISAARMMLYEAAKAYDEAAMWTLGAMAKLYASEVAHRATDGAVQVWGGLGYCKPTVVERLYRDQRILEIYEGASEIQRLVLARAVRKEAEAAAAASANPVPSQVPG
jgi:alkylation response protein AidB-like acyl-CoA dehydrogenase